MVKFTRRIQELNRVAIPQEIMKELGWEHNDYITVEIQADGVIIIKK